MLSESALLRPSQWPTCAPCVADDYYSRTVYANRLRDVGRTDGRRGEEQWLKRKDARGQRRSSPQRNVCIAPHRR